MSQLVECIECYITKEPLERAYANNKSWLCQNCVILLVLRLKAETEELQHRPLCKVCGGSGSTSSRKTKAEKAAKKDRGMG